MPTTIRPDGSDTTEGSISDSPWSGSGTTTILGALKGIYNKVGGGGGSSSAVTVADGADTAQGTTTDASSASTIVGILKAIKAAVQGTLATSHKAQTSATDTLQNARTADGNGTVSTTDGYETLQLLITNGAGTCTVTIQGSLDAAFTTAQDAVTLGVVKLSDSGAGVNTGRSVVSGAIAVAANTSYLFSIYDVMPNVRAVMSVSSGLGAGTNDTGCTVKLYKVPV